MNNPISISAHRGTQVVTITWGDGHISEYPFGLLRMACPCASCRGGHENMSADPDPIVFTHERFPDVPENHMVNLEGVGSYAVSFHWEDGHQSGIYNWNYLRKLCPCGICRPKE
ncbi:MAG: gamma-butyrobetaine hydroxylase family protein [Bellilinea sp.]